METIQTHQLSNQEKTLITMGAAMGAGCRTCADKLYEMATSLNISKAEMLKAFLLGLDAKQAAVETMREKVAALMADEHRDEGKEFPKHLTALIRMASFTAANSAPDFLAEMKPISSTGIPAEHIQLCVATGKMVRTHAIGFSDGDISAKIGNAEANIRGACCSGSPNAENTSTCSCG